MCMKKKAVIEKTLILAGVGILSGAVLNAEAAVPDKIWELQEGTDDEGNIICDFEEIEVVFPADWQDRYVLECSGDHISVIAKSVLDEFGGIYQEGSVTGVLFWIYAGENYDFMTDGTPYRAILGSSDTYIYYLSTVQGQPYDGSSAAAEQDWQDLYSDVDWIMEHSSVTEPGEGVVDMSQVSEDIASEKSGDYILPDSSKRLLNAADLKGMNANDLQMAVNEIYARHQRRFVTKSIQQYFDSKSWYNGTVEAEKFHPEVLSDIENQNIALMIRCMNGAENSGLSAGTQMTATAWVNVRSGAGISSSIMGVVPQGDTVIVTGDVQNGWIPVSYNGIRGYISQDYLSVGAGTGTGTDSGSSSAGQWDVDDTAGSASVSEAQEGGTDSGIVAAVRVYTGDYREASSYNPGPIEDMPQYYTLSVYTVSDTAFSFGINQIDRASQEVTQCLLSGTAYFTEDGTEAVYDGSNGEVSFTFPDNHGALPDVTDITVSGVPEIEGTVMINNGVPGHEFS